MTNKGGEINKFAELDSPEVDVTHFQPRTVYKNEAK